MKTTATFGGKKPFTVSTREQGSIVNEALVVVWPGNAGCGHPNQINGSAVNDINRLRSNVLNTTLAVC